MSGAVLSPPLPRGGTDSRHGLNIERQYDIENLIKPESLIQTQNSKLLVLLRNLWILFLAWFSICVTADCARSFALLLVQTKLARGYRQVIAEHSYSKDEVWF